LEKATSRAKEILSLLGRDSEVAIVLGSEGAEAPLADLSQDRARATRVLDGIHPTLKAADLPLAVRRATQLLGPAGHAERRIYVITDGAAHAWDQQGLPKSTSPELVLVDVTDDKAPANHGVVSVEVTPAPQLGARGVRFSAQIANFSDKPEKDL